LPEIGLVDAARSFLDGEGVNLAGLGLAWARLAPTVAVVPAFGLRAVPAPVRTVLGLTLAVSIAPALRPLATERAWAIAFALEALRGVPLALATAVPLWAATMVGGAIDAVRGAGEATQLPVLEGRSTPLGALFGLLASLAFLASGGPSRVAMSVLEVGGDPVDPFLGALHALTAGTGLAVAIAGPVIAASIVIEVGLALIARAASPANVQSLVALARGVGVLAVVALLFERLSAAVTVLASR
jgi:type III secretory pathway component EscT